MLVHVHFLRLEQFGTEHRSQRDSHERRGTAYDGDDPSQFMEHDTRHSVQHRQGHEHRHEHEGRRDDGYPDLVGSVDRRLMRILTTLHVTGDILQDDNRVIHHHTDRDGERTEGDDIQTRIRHTEVDKRHDEGNRNRDTDNDGSTPFTEEEEHDEHDEEEGVKHRLFEGVDGVLDILRGVVDLLYLHVRRQLFLYLRQCCTHVAADLHGVSTCLLGDDQTHRLTAIGLLVQGEVLDGILDRRYIADEDLLTLRRHSYHEVLDLGGLDVLRTHLHLVLLLRHLDRTRREVEVVRRNDLPHLLQGYAVGIEFLLVDIDIDIAFRRTREGDISDTVNMVQLRHHLVVEDLVQTRIRLIRRDGVLADRHRTRGEFEDHRLGAVVRQVVRRHIDERTHVVHRLFHVTTPLQLQRHHGDIILGLRSDVFEVIDGGQGVLHDLRHVGLHLARRCARIGSHDRDIRRVHLRELVSRQLQETKYTDDDDRHKDEGGGHRFLDC